MRVCNQLVLRSTGAFFSSASPCFPFFPSSSFWLSTFLSFSFPLLPRLSLSLPPPSLSFSFLAFCSFDKTLPYIFNWSSTGFSSTLYSISFSAISVTASSSFPLKSLSLAHVISLACNTMASLPDFPNSSAKSQLSKTCAKSFSSASSLLSNSSLFWSCIRRSILYKSFSRLFTAIKIRADVAWISLITSSTLVSSLSFDAWTPLSLRCKIGIFARVATNNVLSFGLVSSTASFNDINKCSSCSLSIHDLQTGFLHCLQYILSASCTWVAQVGDLTIASASKFLIATTRCVFVKRTRLCASTQLPHKKSLHSKQREVAVTPSSQLSHCFELKPCFKSIACSRLLTRKLLCSFSTPEYSEEPISAGQTGQCNAPLWVSTLCSKHALQNVCKHGRSLGSS